MFFHKCQRCLFCCAGFHIAIAVYIVAKKFIMVCLNLIPGRIAQDYVKAAFECDMGISYAPMKRAKTPAHFFLYGFQRFNGVRYGRIVLQYLFNIMDIGIHTMHQHIITGIDNFALFRQQPLCNLDVISKCSFTL